MEVPLFIRILQPVAKSKRTPLAEEMLRDLTDAYYLASDNKDKKAMNRIELLASGIGAEISKYVNSGPDDKTFVNESLENDIFKGRLSYLEWEKMRSSEHTGKTNGKSDFEITEHDGYKEILEKVENRAKAYIAVKEVYYLNKGDGAKGFGHAAILLLNSEGNGTFYSFAAKLSTNLLVGLDVDAQMGKLYMIMDQINDFLETGILAGIKDYQGIVYNGDGTDHYSGFIYMPVSNKQISIEMVRKAEDIYSVPGYYNLFENNCNHTVQQILEKGGMDFTPTGGSAIDEQNTMVDFLVSNHKISSIVAQIIKDSLDCTVPNSAFIFGKLLAISNDWRVGKLGR